MQYLDLFAFGNLILPLTVNTMKHTTQYILYSLSRVELYLYMWDMSGIYFMLNVYHQIRSVAQCLSRLTM